MTCEGVLPTLPRTTGRLPLHSSQLERRTNLGTFWLGSANHYRLDCVSCSAEDMEKDSRKPLLTEQTLER